eukprot:scaffold1052_cov339-Pavlova_lutheri.AAC.52
MELVILGNTTNGQEKVDKQPWIISACNRTLSTRLLGAEPDPPRNRMLNDTHPHTHIGCSLKENDLIVVNPNLEEGKHPFKRGVQSNKHSFRTLIEGSVLM